MSTGSYPRGTEDYYWGPIEVISEPVKGNDFNTQPSRYPQVAVEDDKIYTVWSDSTNLNGSGGDTDVFYRYFNGSQWSEIQVLSEPVAGSNTNNGASFHPDIAVENGKIYVIWDDNNNTNGAGTDKDIFFRCNLTGSGWEDVQVVSEPVPGNNFNDGGSNGPAIVVENGKIYVVWYDRNNTNNAGTEEDIFFKCNLTGYSWEEVQVISEPSPNKGVNIEPSIKPRIAVENGGIYVVWQDQNDTNGAGTFERDIFYRCNLTGSGWEPVQVISEPVFGQDNNYLHSDSPDIAIENGKIYVVWQDINNTNGAGSDWDIFYRCNLTGSNWEDTQVISEPLTNKDINTGPSMYPAIAVENDIIYVIWLDWNDTDNSGIDSDIFFTYNASSSSSSGSGSGNKWSDVEGISEPVPGSNLNIGYAEDYPSAIAVNHGKSYVIWGDENNTDGSGVDLDIHYRGITFLPPFLTQGSVTPTSGNTSTWFNYTVTYGSANNDTAIYVKLCIDGINYTMIEVDKDDNIYLDGKLYYYNITHLGVGIHTYQFWTADGSYTRFTLLKNNPMVYNTQPNITTDDNLTAIEDIYYEVSYEYEDIDRENVGQPGHWNFSSNASWLNFDNITGRLSGTPTNSDVGSCWVNISINDTRDMDSTNFTLSVLNTNDDPVINTTNIEFTYEDELYEVDYNATDIDNPLSDLTWSLKTNATTWLNFDPSTGILNGTPTNDEVGNYCVNISVNDSENGEVFTNFTLIVLNVNDPPIIITEDVLTVNESKLYLVDYNATDIDPTEDTLTWSLYTNASWLGIDSGTGVLSGIPTEDNLGFYGVNVSVNDGNDEMDWHEFILTVVKGNEPPIITTTDVVSTTVEVLYQVDYDAIDDRTPLDQLLWSLKTNGSWLSIEINTGILSGTPTLGDLGWHWVNVSVGDGEGGFDSHNFTLIVYLTANLPPKITTEDVTNAIVGILYSVDYEATDDRTLVKYLQWSLETNASWLNITTNTGILSGTPELSDLGWYWINISVKDDENGLDFHYFILKVLNVPNNVPELTDPTLKPSEGDIETDFVFSVHYYDADGDPLESIELVIDDKEFTMTLKKGENASNGLYEYKTKLSVGNHTYYFTASDGIDSVGTDTYITPDISNVSDDKDDETAWDWLIWLVIFVIIIIIVLVLLLIFMRKKKAEEKSAVEEEETPPEEEPPSEAPSEQLPTPEVPPVQPPPPEVPPEQPPSETPPPEQPPITEVTPQVTEPQVEPAPSPQQAPIPQVEEQTTPQVEPQPQVEAQEPAVEPHEVPQQQPVPKVKTQPKIEEEDA